MKSVSAITGCMDTDSVWGVGWRLHTPQPDTLLHTRILSQCAHCTVGQTVQKNCQFLQKTGKTKGLKLQKIHALKQPWIVFCPSLAQCAVCSVVLVVSDPRPRHTLRILHINWVTNMLSPQHNNYYYLLSTTSLGGEEDSDTNAYWKFVLNLYLQLTFIMLEWDYKGIFYFWMNSFPVFCSSTMA